MDDNEERRGEARRPNYRSQSMPRQSRFGDRLAPPPGRGGPDNRSLYNESGFEMQPSSKGRKRERPGKLFVSPVFDVYYPILIIKTFPSKLQPRRP